MTMPRVMVLHNTPMLPADHPDADAEHDVIDTADIIQKILAAAGLTVTQFSFVHNLADLVQGVEGQKPDVVFNLYEGTADWSNSEAYVAAALEMMRIPFTGSSAESIMVSRSKPLAKRLLLGAELPTARFREVETNQILPNDLGWPVIVKPSREDASIGIDQNSVVTNQDQLIQRVEYLRGLYGPEVHFEQFIHGREFHVAVLDRNNTLGTLPFSEIFFHETEGPDALWPIVSFDAKWKENSRDFKATPVKNPADVDPVLAKRVSDVAVKAFRLLGCRDYARIDFRVSEAGEPFILEVNPNPCISPLAGVAEALTSAKIPFAEFALNLVQSALRRGSKPELANFPIPHIETSQWVKS
jgi:D-alanine-D-alanine ligase